MAQVAQLIPLNPEQARRNPGLNPRRKPVYPNIEQPYSFALGEFDALPLVRAAMREHDQGMFQRSALIADQMLRDDRIRGAFQSRANKLLGAPQTFQDEEGKKPDSNATVIKPKKSGNVASADKAKMVAEVARLGFRKMLPRASAYNLFRWGHFIGFGLARLLWSTDNADGLWKPTAQIWHPRFVRYDMPTDTFRVATMNLGEIVIEEGTGEWLVYAPYGRRDGWMHALVRCLYAPWLARQWTRRDWSRYSEAHGIPMIKAIVPAAAQEDDETRYICELAERGTESVVRSRKTANGDGYDFELVEATANTWMGFQGLISACNNDISIAIKGENLTTEVKSGSLAAADVHEDVADDLSEADNCTFSEAINEQLFNPWARFNYPEGEAVAPELCYGVEPEEDKNSAGLALKAIGDGIASLQATGIQLDKDKLAKRYDIPTTGPSKDPEPAPAPRAGNPASGGLPPGRGGAPVGRTLTASVTTAQDKDADAGQAKLDLIKDDALRAAVQAMSPERLKVLTIIQRCTTPEQLKDALADAFAGMDPDRLADVFNAALVESEMNGMYSAREG